jgi:predicted N-acetyltransferase YhbS
MLGPLAVETVHAGKGYGKQLVAEGLAKARDDGVRLVVLVGDTNYYERFGFVPVPPGQISLPGPADPRRILAAELAPGALADYLGLVAPDRGA